MHQNTKSLLLMGLGLVLFPHLAFAQEKAPQTVGPVVTPSAVEAKELRKDQITYQDAVTKKEEKEDSKKFLTLSFENDMIGGGTDSNYTNGVRATYMDTTASVPKLIDEAVEWIPTFDINDTTGIYYSIGQNLYTPEDIEQRNVTDADRPYAAWLYVSAGLATAYENHVDEVEVSVGMVGPAALGEQAQKFVHKAVDSPKPLGWRTQLENEPGLILSWQRSWQNYNDFDLQGYTIRTTPHVGATAGNIYTYANTGVSFSFMPTSQPLQGNPLRIRPAIPGNGYYDVPDHNFGWYLFGGVEGRAIARNIFLDGNTFSSSNEVDKKNFVGDANIGIAFTVYETRLAYTLSYRTKEYDTQSDPQVFGSLSLSQRF